MGSEYQHKILVVDDDVQISKAIGRILREKKIEFVTADSGESALAEIKKADKPFSIIISDQRMPEMQGSDFLDQAKKLTPNSIRFIMTAYSEMETIIKAVNKGAIQKYITKPWDHDKILNEITSAIKRFELFLENEKLLHLAKKQNTTLYDLNCELMEKTKSHNKTIHDIDQDIETLENQIKNLSAQTSIKPVKLQEEIENHVKETQGIDSKKTNALFSKTIEKLYEDFKELSSRNGFEMPDIEGEV